MNSQHDYCTSYFSFIDLLGFKEIVKSKSCSEIISIFEEVKKEYVLDEVVEGTNVPFIPPESIHYYIMSDSICIYIHDEVKAALPVLAILSMMLQVRLLCCDMPILARGSIVKGEIYGDGSVLFGPALVEAYLREEKLANVPRIIISENLIEEHEDQFDRAILNSITYKEQDGFYTLRYLDYFCHHNATVPFFDGLVGYLKNRLNTEVNQSVREKIMYVKTWIDYYSGHS